MSNTAGLGAAIQEWLTPEQKLKRFQHIRELSKDAGLELEFEVIPRIHIETLDFRGYTILVLALAKIREARQRNLQQPVD